MTSRTIEVYGRSVLRSFALVQFCYDTLSWRWASFLEAWEIFGAEVVRGTIFGHISQRAFIDCMIEGLSRPVDTYTDGELLTVFRQVLKDMRGSRQLSAQGMLGTYLMLQDLHLGECPQCFLFIKRGFRELEVIKKVHAESGVLNQGSL